MPNATSQTIGSTIGTTANQGTSTNTPTDPTTTTAKNLANIPGLSNLTSLINAINQNSQSNANLGRITGEAGLEAQSSQNISDALAGKVSGSTKAVLGQETAEAGIGSGMASDAAYLRLLGQTSEGLQGTGQTWLSAATARNPAAATYDPTTGLLTAAQGGNTTTTSQTGQTTGQTVQNAAQQTAGSQEGGGGGSGGGASPTAGTGTNGAATGAGGAATPYGFSLTPQETDTASTSGLNPGGGGNNTNPWASLGFSDTEYNAIFGSSGEGWGALGAPAGEANPLTDQTQSAPQGNGVDYNPYDGG